MCTGNPVSHIQNQEPFSVFNHKKVKKKGISAHVYCSPHRPASPPPGETNGITSTEQLVGRFQVSVPLNLRQLTVQMFGKSKWNDAVYLACQNLESDLYRVIAV